jgi:hypothetical protein
MTASSPAPAHRPVPTVAIVGNDAVLYAAPATPVQLAHACLRRGFTVAVPASWGDELVAAETVRRMAGRAQGPAVMCVCPFVRARLLAPGPDLAPFLVSLVAPPVAVARYLRAVYGDLGVHITYIGNCPSADDAAIDASLTPDAFFADIAERGIALSEQPLVFDSIVPPDRRRWWSLPGGVPSPDVLWNEGDGRALVEIERNDISTDLAQHIVTREHVLLDPAPGLGCVCSGAIASVSPRNARAAVTALEPPRALGPVVDPATVVVLDAPVSGPRFSALAAPSAAAPNVVSMLASSHELGSEILDMIIGRSIAEGPVEGVELTDIARRHSPAPDSELPFGPPVHPAAEFEPVFDPASTAHTNGVAVGGSTLIEAPPATPMVDASDDVVRVDRAAGFSDVTTAPLTVTVGDSDVETFVETPTDRFAEDAQQAFGRDVDDAPPASTAALEEPHGPRRRTPVATPVRHPAANIPRTAASDGRLLPRAYVAKRRTPPASMPPLVNEPVGRPRTEPGQVAPVSTTTAMPAPPMMPAPVAPPAAPEPRRPSPPAQTRASNDAEETASRRPGSLGVLLLVAFIALAVFVLVTLQR